MADVYLRAISETGKQDVEIKPKTPMQEIDDALKACKFGLFHIRLLFTSLFGFVCGLVVSNTVPYILPNAECDLHLDMVEKGVLNAAPFVGMVLVSAIAGFLTDTFGRKIFLVGGYGGIFVCALISSLSQTFVTLVIAKFFEGILFASAFSPTVTFTAEFCHKGIRDRVMLIQSSYHSIAQVALAALSWGILTLEWRFSFFDGLFVLNTWNFYLLIISLWPLTGCILYCFLPESPKYLITQERYDEARNVLINMYTQNTGKSADTFPYRDIWKNLKSQSTGETEGTKAEIKKKSFRHMLVTGLHNIKPIFRKPLGPYLIIFCVMNFFIMALYNVIRLWFPQLSTIVEHYSSTESDLCGMLDTYTYDLRAKTANTTVSDVCVPTKSGAETYTNSIIQGCVCFLPYILIGAIVNKAGKKNLQIVISVISVACTLAIRWARTKTEVIALLVTDVAVGQTLMNLLQLTTVEVFPTVSRTLAVGVTMTCGRLGSLAGNIMFPILLKMGCAVPFFTLTGIMIGKFLRYQTKSNKKIARNNILTL